MVLNSTQLNHRAQALGHRRGTALLLTALFAALTVSAQHSTTATAATVTTNSYALPGCGQLHDSQQPSLPGGQPNHPYACLYYGVNATQSQERVSPVPPHYDWYSGYYFTGSSWVQGSAGYIALCNGPGCTTPSNASLLTNVVFGTPEQVGTWLFAGNPFYMAY